MQRRLFALYQRGDYEGALRLVEREGPRLDVLWTKVAWWRACLLARLDRPEEALGVLQAALEAGAWWSRASLEREPDFQAIKDDPRFVRLMEECERRRWEYSRRLPGLSAAGLDRGRMVVALHGRAETYEAAVGYWMPAALAAGWGVMVPESSQRDSIDGPCWDDPDRARREILDQVSRLSETYHIERLVIAGYSQGGRRALQLGLEHPDVFAGVFAVSPSVARPSDVAEVLSALGEAPHPAVQVVAGGLDAVLPAQEMLVGALVGEGVPARLEIVPHLGHYYPEDLAARLAGFLDQRVACERREQTE